MYTYFKQTDTYNIHTYTYIHTYIHTYIQLVNLQEEYDRYRKEKEEEIERLKQKISIQKAKISVCMYVCTSVYMYVCLYVRNMYVYKKRRRRSRG
jgi:hypothetical protein